LIADFFGILLFLGLLGAVLVLLCYREFIYYTISCKSNQKKLNAHLMLLPELYEECRVVETKALGEGIDPYTSISFRQAHVHQKEAMATIMSMINLLED